MRKFSILIQLRFIYVYMFIYLVIGYFYDSYLKHIGLYKFIEIYFGISFFFILFLVLLDFYSYFIRCSRKKMVYSTRKFFFCVLVISCIFLYFMYNLNIPLKKELADEKLLAKSIEIIFYQKKFGLILTFLFDILISKFYFLYLYVAFYLLAFISFFFIGAKTIRKTIRKIIRKIIMAEKERREIKRNREALEEQERIIKWIEEKERQAREEEKDDIGI